MAAEPRVWEVFRRERVGAPMVHAGNIAAESEKLALIYAREVYGRRGESSLLWVAPRDAIAVLDDPDILQPAVQSSYRLVEGYRMRDKLHGLEQRLQQEQEKS